MKEKVKKAYDERFTDQEVSSDKELCCVDISEPYSISYSIATDQNSHFYGHLAACMDLRSTWIAVSNKRRKSVGSDGVKGFLLPSSVSERRSQGACRDRVVLAVDLKMRGVMTARGSRSVTLSNGMPRDGINGRHCTIRRCSTSTVSYDSLLLYIKEISSNRQVSKLQKQAFTFFRTERRSVRHTSEERRSVPYFE